MWTSVAYFTLGLAEPWQGFKEEGVPMLGRVEESRAGLWFFQLPGPEVPAHCDLGLFSSPVKLRVRLSALMGLLRGQE